MNPHFRLRRASEKDGPAVSALTRAAYAKWVALIGREPMPMKADHEAAIRQHLVDLLEIDGTLAALIEMIPEGEWLLIENVAVAPIFQRRGFGRALLEQAEQIARAQRLKGVRLYTNKLFQSNIDFYSRYGFAVDREESFKGGTTVYMCKPFAD
jgi:ribosomal protein S18 acetylase RimI-like enzyme